jgi:predicted RNase H-like HicB family nuclease
MALTKDEAMQMIKKAQEDTFDIEAAHGNADDALCGFLEHLGHDDIVREWHKVKKWYA